MQQAVECLLIIALPLLWGLARVLLGLQGSSLVLWEGKKLTVVSFLWS